MTKRSNSFQMFISFATIAILVSCGKYGDRAQNLKSRQVDQHTTDARLQRCAAWRDGIMMLYEATGSLPDATSEVKIHEAIRFATPYQPLAKDQFEWNYGPEYKDPENGLRYRNVRIIQYNGSDLPVTFDDKLCLDLWPIRWDPMYEGVAEADAKMHLDTSPSNLSKVVACAVWKESQKAKRWITQPDLLRADEEYREADDEQLLVGFSARIEKMFKGKRAWFEKNDKGGWIVVTNSSTGIEYWFPDDGPETKRIAVTMTPDGKRVRLR